MNSTEYLERRAFYAGFSSGLCACIDGEITPAARHAEWRKFLAEPLQYELPLEEAPDEQNAKV